MAALSSFIVTRNDRYAHDYRQSSCYKMAAPLNTCTTIEQRGVVRFLWAKGMAGKDIHKEMLPMYGEHCLSRQAVHNWVQNFSEGRTSIEDEHRVGRPVKEQCTRGSERNHKNFTPQVSRDL